MTGSHLEIVVTSGTGEAPSELAAFDAALHQAGVANFNLIRLSSLIPPGSQVTAPASWQAPPGRWGDRLYVVYAEHRVSAPGYWAWAGLGWAQDRETDAGILVEHHGASQHEVEDSIDVTLDDLKARRPGQYGANVRRTAGIVCQHQPVTAVVVAAFQVEPW